MSHVSSHHTSQLTARRRRPPRPITPKNALVQSKETTLVAHYGTKREFLSALVTCAALAQSACDACYLAVSVQENVNMGACLAGVYVRSRPIGVTLGVLRQLRDLAAERRASEGPPRSWRAAWESPPYSRRAAGEALSTEDVCFEIVRPYSAETAHRRYLDVVPASEVGPATVFVSHGWATMFADTVEAIDAAALPSSTKFW